MLQYKVSIDVCEIKSHWVGKCLLFISHITCLKHDRMINYEYSDVKIASSNYGPWCHSDSAVFHVREQRVNAATYIVIFTSTKVWVREEKKLVYMWHIRAFTSALLRPPQHKGNEREYFHLFDIFAVTK